MKRFYVNQDLKVDSTLEIEGIEHNHIKNVMRLNVGDQILLVCGDEFDYTAEIISLSKGSTRVKILSQNSNIYNTSTKVTVFQALIKSDNMSLIIQKLTELGVSDFVPFESEFITAKDKIGKTEKLQEISNQSIKQCKRSKPMIIHETIKFNKLIEKLGEYDIILFANECERNIQLDKLPISSDKSVAIIIGSEGGFSASEIEKLTSIGAKSITLGKRILRAETACLALTSVIMFLLGEWNYE